MASAETPEQSMGDLRDTINGQFSTFHSLIDEVSIAQYRYFTCDDFSNSRANTLTATGKPEEEMAFKIPEDTTAFNMVANFDNCASGHYRISWRIKLLKDFAVSEGLRFNANVSYEAELNTEVTLDVFMRLPKLEKLANDRRYDLELEETLTVQPHTKSARIKVVLCNMENRV
ncbi:hypothetical protein BGX26_003057 [Mortierella sp. AD094]|nr:hypothetical protein BGX26_003057 [Mortierella sp. AD094]